MDSKQGFRVADGKSERTHVSEAFALSTTFPSVASRKQEATELTSIRSTVQQSAPVRTDTAVDQEITTPRSRQLVSEREGMLRNQSDLVLKC